MSITWLFILLFLIPGICFIAWLALSSCLGADLRTHLSKRRVEPSNSNRDIEAAETEGTDFDKHYFRAMADGGVALDEFIEMRNLMEDPPGEEYD